MNLCTKQIGLLMQKLNLWLPEGKGGGEMDYKIGIDVYNTIHKMDN